MGKEEDNNKPKEGEDMSALLDNKKITLREMLDRISENAEVLTGKDNMIELDPNNPFHREWYEIDKYQGK